VLPKLQAQYGEALYRPVSIPPSTYTSIDAEVRTFGVSNVLVVPANFDAQRAYLIVKTMFEKKASLAAAHAEARNLSLQTAVAGSPVPLHEGAMRYYAEAGAVPSSPAVKP